MLVKTGSDKIRIVGWTDKKKLKSTPARDIYRNGKMCHVVHDTNLSDMTIFKIKEEKNKILLTEFIINQQTAENLGAVEYINPIVAGLHYFAKKAKVYYKDINQVDECIIGDKKAKIYTRDAKADEDMLIYEEYYKKHPEIDIFILCKIKGGNYSYIGYIPRHIVDQTRVVQMIGQDSDKASKDIRRIYAEQYSNLSDVIQIWVDDIEKEEEIVPQNYVPLHLHSEYSIGDAFGKIDYIVDSLRRKGFKGAALTDHGTLGGSWDFQKKMLEAGLKPIIGCEIYLKIDGIDRRFHTVVLVKNKVGWHNLLKLQSMAVREHFHYKPIVPFEELLKHAEGLIVTSGCLSSPIPVCLSKEQYDMADELALKFKEAFGEDFYCEFQPNIVLDNPVVMERLLKFSEKHGFKRIIATDSHYANKEDIKYHEAVKAIDGGKDYGTAGYGDTVFYHIKEDELRQLVAERHPFMSEHLDDMMQNTLRILDKIDFKIEPPKESDTLPKFLPDQAQRKEKLRELCIKGLETYTPYKYEGAIKDRLDLEIDRMLSKDYENYFLIVWDMIKWAKENGIRVGPGRGSVGASLAAYTLNITECDPIEYELLFDRFLSEIRRDMPDVDMDFMDHRRGEVYNYLRKKYGDEHCAKVVTYARFHAKGIIKDVARIFNIPFLDANKLSSMVIERSGGDARASFSLQDTFDEFAEAKKFKEMYPEAADIAVKLEGHIRHRGIHAAAMVVTEKNMNEYVPIGKLHDEIMVEWEKQQCEDMKLVKFDILGLKTLSVIQDAVASSGCTLPKRFDDKEIYKNVFQAGDTAGVFQFETVGMSKMAQAISVKSFDELYDCTTLFRPGALHSGQAQIYVNRSQGKEEAKPFHPLLFGITKKTKGIILYQEQIMQIMNQVGGMSWATAEMARKVITKSKGKDAFNKMRDEFVRNAGKLHKMTEQEAQQLYDVVSTFGSYSFNVAHAVEYSIISYQCAWLKHYYPMHFFAALLKYEEDKAQIFRYMQEAARQGVNIEYPDINKSKESYSIAENSVYAGFDSIDGIGSKTAQKVIKLQPYTSVEDFIKRAKPTKKLWQGLIIADAFRSFAINKKVCFKHDPKDDFKPVDKLTDDFSDIEWTKLIYHHTSLKPRMNITETYDFGNYDFVNIGELEKHAEKQVILRGLITDVINKDKLLRNELKEHVHKFEQHMIYLNLNDGTGDVAAQVSPHTYELYSNLIEHLDKQPVIILATASRDGKKAYVDMMQVVAGEHKSGDVDAFFAKTKLLKDKQAVIASAQPGVSKKKNSYYRVRLHNGISGLVFRPPAKLLPGMIVGYQKGEEPFLSVFIPKETMVKK